MPSSELCISAFQGTAHSAAFREFYLANWSTVPPPFLGVSKALPQCLVLHLMRSKKLSSRRIKYKNGDKITCIEGALHSLLVPIVSPVHMHGDYQYSHHHGHTVPRFPSQKQNLSRNVVLSALVQPDFENLEVWAHLARLEENTVLGEKLPSDFSVAPPHLKENPKFRADYDARLKRHLVAWFATNGKLAALSEIKSPYSDRQAVEALRAGSDPENMYIETHSACLDVGFVYNLVKEQIAVELRALEECARLPYIYTWDPPAIFARVVSPALLNQLWVRAFATALNALHAESAAVKLKVVAFNDYDDQFVVQQLAELCPAKVVPRTRIFSGSPPTLDATEVLEKPFDLVIHNNSDGFGQNVQSMEAHTSLDGAIGCSSSAAASLLPERPDLCETIVYFDA